MSYMRIHRDIKTINNKDLKSYLGNFMRNLPKIREFLCAYPGKTMRSTGKYYLWINYVVNIVIHIPKKYISIVKRGSRGCNIPLRTTFVARKMQYKGVVSTPLKSQCPVDRK